MASWSMGIIARIGLALVAVIASNALADTVRIGGTGGASEPFRQIAARFTAATGITTEIIPGLGSAGGISAAADGVVQLAISGRPPTAAETARGLDAAFEVCTPYVLASSHPSPGSFEHLAVAAIYAREAPIWPDGTPLRIVLRPKAESDNATMAALFPGTEQSVAQARDRASIPIGATDQDNADLAEQIPGSLIGATYAQILTEHRTLRFVAIDGIAPNVEAYENGRYPFGKRLQLVMARQKIREAGLLLDFLHSRDGAAAMRDVGIVPCPG